MKISQWYTQPPQDFVVDTGANDPVSLWFIQENMNSYAFNPRYLHENVDPLFPWILSSELQEAWFEYHLDSSCYCISSRTNNGIDNLACLFCKYRSRRLTSLHPEVASLLDPEDVSRYPMFRHYDQQLTIRDKGARNKLLPNKRCSSLCLLK